MFRLLNEPAARHSSPAGSRWIALIEGVLIVLLAAGAGTGAGCSEEHCVSCGEGDADLSHGGDGLASPGDACSPSPEQCDEHDHDCDGEPHNGFSLLTDPANCGSCGNACEVPGAAGSCVGGECSYVCLPHYHDANGDLDQPGTNGCEYPCVADPGGIEIPCNSRDDDCDTFIDEDFVSDAEHCGSCFNHCVAAHADATCDDQGTADPSDDACSYATCHAGYADLDGDDEPTDVRGCEYTCPVYPAELEEECNGVDDDCDGETDELPIAGLGAPCYPENLEGCVVGVGCLGVCELGELQCSFGLEICSNYQGPEPTELCDAVDHDCDGEPRNGFDTANDPNHCGDSCTACALPHAVNGCRDTGAGGECYVLECQPGWVDADGDDEPTDELGCEYPCTPSGPELCDGKDNDCDGLVDELGPGGVSPPAAMTCKNQGECDGPIPVCSECAGVTTWRCDYSGSPGDVEVDACGALVVQETWCDGRDNDCDGEIDESYPQVANTPTEEGDPCDDGHLGVCRGVGTWICDPTDRQAVLCRVTEPGQALAGELCNNLDDNCNGLVDELEDEDGYPVTQLDPMVEVSGGTTSSGDPVFPFLIDLYEASRPDADASSGGSVERLACSRPGVVPWQMVSHAEAEAACLAAGKRLCTEFEWQRACEGAGPFGANYVSYPYGFEYAPYACNGWDYDVDCTLPNDNYQVHLTGAEYGCPFEPDTCLSVLGVYDLSGNVQEWTLSLIATGPDTYRVRGGNYRTQPDGLTCQHAVLAFDDTIASAGLGFRCCRDLP